MNSTSVIDFSHHVGFLLVCVSSFNGSEFVYFIAVVMLRLFTTGIETHAIFADFQIGTGQSVVLSSSAINGASFVRYPVLMHPFIGVTCKPAVTPERATKLPIKIVCLFYVI